MLNVSFKREKQNWDQRTKSVFTDRSFFNPVSNKSCENCWFNSKGGEEMPPHPCEHMPTSNCEMHSYSEPSLTKMRMHDELTETKRLMKKGW